MPTATIGVEIEAPPKVSPRRRIRNWVDREISNEIEYERPEMKGRAREHFKQDREVVEALYEIAFDSLFDGIVDEAVRATHGNILSTGSKLTPRKDLEKRAMLRWLRWVENDGKRDIKLYHARTENLDGMIAQRVGQTVPEIRKIRFLRRLRDGTVESGKTVGETFSRAELGQIYDEEMEREVTL